MKAIKLFVPALLLCSLSARAGADDSNRIQLLQKQLSKMEEHFEKVRLEQKAEIESLKRELGNASGNIPSPSNDKDKLEAELKQELGSAQDGSPGGSLPAPTQAFSTAQPIGIARAGSSYMNVSFSTMIDVGGSSEPHPSERLELGDHDPQKRGFSLRNAELSLDGAVDPYFKGAANIVFKLDENNETQLELEESYLQTTSLPANLQVKGGQFFANFGRQNPQHPHQWAFVDQPLILNRAFGPEGLRNVGTQVSWLAPTPFYTELFLGIFDGQGGTASSFRFTGEVDDGGVERVHGRRTEIRPLAGPKEFLFTPRIASSFELTDTQTLLTGLSGAFGPNSSGVGNRTQIYGADVYWKWKPGNSEAGFPFVSFQTEALYSKYDVGDDLTAPTHLQSEVLTDYGAYSQILWGFKQGWITGLRGDYVNGNSGAFDAFDRFRGERVRISPVLTYLPSEFSKIRLQFNFDRGEYIPDSQSVWMQFEFDLGDHAAHKF